MSNRIKSVRKRLDKIRSNRGDDGMWRRPGESDFSKGYFYPFDALGSCDKAFCKKWWARWLKRPYGGKAKIRLGIYEGTPPNP